MQPSRRTSRFLLGVLVVLTISYCMISNRFLLPTPAPRDEGQLIERSETNRCNCAYVGGDEPKRIVSYSLFGDLKDRNIRERYYDQLARRLDEIAQRLPGWKVRVYHNASADFVCPFECNKKHSGMVRFYNMNNPLNAQESQINPRLWRFLPLNDEPVVDALLTRDLDSEVSEREVAAVNEWLNSSYSFHVMRDHPFHQAFILAGMWGGKLSQHPLLVRNLGEVMLALGRGKDKEADQRFLWLYVWPVTHLDTMAHDSYFCERWELTLFGWVATRPFPTRRKGFDFVGSYGVNQHLANSTEGLTTCPVKCRPNYGQDWSYC